jgi:hypothetical protein
LLEQINSTPEKVAPILTELVENDLARAEMQTALAQWHAPKAAEQIAENILSAIRAGQAFRRPGERVATDDSPASPSNAGGTPALLFEQKFESRA